MKVGDKICDKKMDFSECEKLILRTQVDKAKDKMAKRAINTPEIKEMIEIVEAFIKKKKLICYGGTALNNILPEEDQFYNKETELADYDFFSSNALDDAKELTDIFFKKGFTECEAKSGQHHGTYKVYVNFLGIADITSTPKVLFNALKKEAIKVNGILYAPVNYLRMAVFLEISHPAGDVDRWEKIWDRLELLNKHYPLKVENCKQVDFQRKMENNNNVDKIYQLVKNSLIQEGVVFFGGYAIAQYSQYMPKNLRNKVKQIPDFDVLSNDPKKTADFIKKKLEEEGVSNVKIIKHESIGEVIPYNYEIAIGDDAIVFIYKPIACHSYNVIMINGKKVKIATIDTMLSFYLAFLYADKPYYNKERILCMSNFLFDVQQRNRLEQKGLLKRFSILCYGHQDSREEMRAEKAEKFNELKNKRDSKEYEEWFLNYKPEPKGTKEPKEIKETKKTKKTKKSKETKKSKKTKKSLKKT